MKSELSVFGRCSLIPVCAHWVPASEGLPQVSGVYAIRNTQTGKVYVGSSNNIGLRCRGHRSNLRHKRHGNAYLQAAWNKSGEEAFFWAVVEEVADLSVLCASEQGWITRLQAAKPAHGYNLQSDAVRHTFTAAVRAKMSAARKGQVAWNKGVPCPEHVKKAIGSSLIGRPTGMSTRLKLSLAMLGPAHPHRGKTLGPEMRAKASASQHATAAKSGRFKGVYLDARTGTFMARIYAEGRNRFLGRYPTEAEAAQAYNNAAMQVFGAGCHLNDVPPGEPQRRTTRGRPQQQEASR